MLYHPVQIRVNTTTIRTTLSRIAIVAAWALAAVPGILAAQTTVLDAAGYVDVRAGEIVRPAVIVTEDDRIAAINPDTVPDGTETYELGDLILLPGLIDAHTHLALDTTGPGWETTPVRWTAAEYALLGADAAERALMAGFTTVRDVSSWRHFPDIALAQAVERGWVRGPRIIAAGHALSITGGHCDITGFNPGVMDGDPRFGIADGVAEVLKAVRYQIKHGAGVIKICATAGAASFEGSAAAQQYSDREIQAAVEEAARHGIRVASHAHGLEGIVASVEAGVASVEHGSMLDRDTARLMQRNDTYLVPTIYLNDRPRGNMPPEIEEKYRFLHRHSEEAFRIALEEGVRIAFGSDANSDWQGDNAKEFYAMVRRGMPVADAIRAATVNAADLLGVDDRGEIAVGLLADLIGVVGNPLEDIRRLEDVTFVMKGGVPVSSR